MTATNLSWLDVAGGKGCIVGLISMILQTEHAAGAAALYVPYDPTHCRHR